jgi:alkylation response protein AidB-like acyl-CoA dehydrogenase
VSVPDPTRCTGRAGTGTLPSVTIAEETTPTDTPEQAEFRAEVKAFLAANAKPRQEVSPWAVNVHTSEDEAREAFEEGCRWQRTLFDNNLAGLTYPVEYGGRGGAPWMESIYREEAANYDVSSGFIAATMAMLLPTLMKHATDEQKAYYIPKILSAEITICQLFSEPGAGSDLASLACRAVRDGDEFVVTGQKVWNSAAQFCNWGMLLTRTDPDAPKHKGITFLLVDMSSPGIEVRPLVQPTRASHFNEVFLSEVRVPVANVVGEINGGWAPARTVLSNESAFIGGGQGISTFERLVLLAQQFGVIDDPVIRERLAVAYTRERVLSFMSERILTAIRARQVPPMDPSIMKLYIADSKVQTGNLGMEIGGAAAQAGDAEETIWLQFELMNRFGISIGGGTNEVQRNNLAERALGLPKEPGYDKNQPWKDIPRS